ncbi:hypothetical protein [Myceligenerans indicum]|uniref:Uncharacterized protein n=1 Tax=Myceligenerans indicum TaxID=2593663 RepID=A0ABS1LIJ9_9MICO|nr:hypothetical protein [Myceligenerans indicum]MBL0886070.1 hypothetical protein [Myceligenerans indicum]
MSVFEPMPALAAARGLVEAAMEDAAQATRVGWDSAAAERFRDEAASLTRLLVAELDALDEAGRLVGELA